MPVCAAIRGRLAAPYPPLWAKIQQRLCEIVVCPLPSKALRAGRKIRRLADERTCVVRLTGPICLP